MKDDNKSKTYSRRNNKINENKNENLNKKELKNDNNEIKNENEENEKVDEKKEVTNKYEHMENNDADKILSNSLKQIYSQIKIDNFEFKNNVFYKNVHHLINGMGIFDKMKKDYVPIKNTQEVLDNIISTDDLIEKYTEKAKKMKD